MKKPEPAPKIHEILKEIEDVKAIFEKTNHPDIERIINKANHEYLYWDKFKQIHTTTALTPEQTWAYLRFTRDAKLIRIPLKDIIGKNFGYWIPNSFLRGLHYLDQNASGAILVDDSEVHAGEKDKFIINSLMEEAIASSQLEGAATTRKVAKAMLRSGRKPLDNSERMIVNNYLTMQMVKKRIKEPLTPQLIKDIHKSITRGTLDKGDSVDRFRNDSENEKVKVYWDDGTILHTPPPARELENRINLMCEYTNAEDKQFTHPAIKAIILHFWLAYDHPFTDGNGRSARALFYWYMLKRGYWLTEYLSISRLIKNAPAQYAKAYLYSEIDSQDLTYFIGYHLKLIEEAMEDVRLYVKRKISEAQEARKLLTVDADLNFRQSQLLHRAITHPTESYTIEQYKNMFGTTYETARSDLSPLEEAGFFKKIKRGKQFLYFPVDNLHKVLKQKKKK